MYILIFRYFFRCIVYLNEWLDQQLVKDLRYQSCKSVFLVSVLWRAFLWRTSCDQSNKRMYTQTGWLKNTQLFLLSTLFWIHACSWVSTTHLLGLFIGKHIVSVSAPWAPCSTDPPGHLLPLAQTVCARACGHNVMSSRSACDGFLATNCISVGPEGEHCERLLQHYTQKKKKTKPQKWKTTTCLFL